MVDQLKEKYDVEVTWLPYFLHPEYPEQGLTPDPELRARYEPMWQRLEQRADQLGLPINRPEHRPNTRRALEASEYARQQDRHEEFHQEVFDMHFHQGQDIHDWEVLREAAEAVGLDPDEMQRRTARGEYEEIVRRHDRQARAMGITGIPTYILNDKYAVVGAQPLEAFERAIGELDSS